MAYRLAPDKPKSPPGFYLVPELEQFRAWEVDYDEADHDIQAPYCHYTDFRAVWRHVTFKGDIPYPLSNALLNFEHPDITVSERGFCGNEITATLTWNTKRLKVRREGESDFIEYDLNNK
jgi:hypothetical protein